MEQTVSLILREASSFNKESPSGRLEKEVLLAHVLGVNRVHLHAYPEQILTETEIFHFQKLLDRYLQGVPVAYLTGHREFWSLDLLVTPDTLIPRPETELLVEWILREPPSHSNLVSDESCLQPERFSIADLGTGSGAIALALAFEKPDWALYATDLSKAALTIAEKNAERLNIRNIRFFEGMWCNALPKIKFDVIVSNPPYIAEGDTYLQQSVLDNEPTHALISGTDGLKDIKHIIQEAFFYLKPGGYLLLEHGFQQAQIVQRIFSEVGYTEISTERDLSGLERATKGRCPNDFIVQYTR